MKIIWTSLTFVRLDLFSQEKDKPVVTVEGKEFDIQEYKRIFSTLDTSLISTKFLVNKVIQMVPFDNYNGTDTAKVTSYNTWKYLYSQIRESYTGKYSVLPTIDSIYLAYSKKAVKIKRFDVDSELENVKANISWEEFIPIAVIDMTYNEIKKDAFEKNLLTVENSQLKEVSSKSKESPYLTKSLYTAAALKDKIYNAGDITFLFDDSFYFTNKDVKKSIYEMDFDDGKGFRKIQLGQTINISYVHTGTKTLKLRKIETENLRALNNGNSLVTVFTISIAAQTPPLPTFTIPESLLTYSIPSNYPHGGVNVKGTAYVLTSDGSTNIRNPIIISDGFDPTNVRDYYGLYEMINSNNFVECIRSNGYDLVILDFADGGTYIERNAYLLKGLIERINTVKTTPNKLIVVGTSMAGLISRYALAYMEQNNIDHDTRLYVSFDSPEKGANIPLGIQEWVKFFASQNSTVEDLYNNMLCCPAARQMLVYHSEYSPDPTNNPYRIAFLQNLNSIGYPSKLRKIAIANGAGNAYGQRKDNGTVFNPTDQIINWDYYNWWTLDLEGNSWAVPNISPQTTIFHGKIDMTWLGHVGAWDFYDHETTVTMEGSYPYDNAPGGTNNTAEMIANEEAPYGDITTTISNHCFIPTISSLAINTSNLFYNISTDLNILSKTPFDAIYYPVNTNEAHAYISQNCISWLNNEVVPQNVELDGINDSWNKGDVRAGNSITLKPGFSTVSGETFHAYISPLLSCNVSLSSSNVIEPDNNIELKSNKPSIDSQKIDVNNRISVFPNPNDGKFQIKSEGIGNISNLTIKNMHGMIVLNMNNISYNEISVNISHYHSGIYFATVAFGNEVKTIKILKR